MKMDYVRVKLRMLLAGTSPGELKFKFFRILLNLYPVNFNMSVIYNCNKYLIILIITLVIFLSFDVLSGVFADYYSFVNYWILQ